MAADLTLRWSLPRRMEAARAHLLGFDIGPMHLVVTLSGVRLGDDGVLSESGDHAVVAWCSSTGEFLASLSPPTLSGVTWNLALNQGVPVFRLPWTPWSGGLRLERRPPAEQSLGAEPCCPEILEVLGSRGDPVAVGWPVWLRHDHTLALDGARGDPTTVPILAAERRLFRASWP